MTFPTTETRQTVTAAFEDADSLLRQIRATAIARRADLAARPVNALDRIVNGIYVPLFQARARLIMLSGKSEFADAAIDLAAEFAALLAAIDSVLAAAQAVIPTDADRNLLVLKFDPVMPEGLVFTMLTPAQTATLVTALDNLIASIG